MPSNAVPIIEHIDKALSKELKRSQTDYYKELQLSIRLSLDGFSFNILDIEKNKHLALVSYLLQEIPDYDELKKEINNIFAQHYLLQRLYSRTYILFETNKSTLIPSALFDSNAIHDYLGFNHFLHKDDEVHFDKLVNLEAYQVYAVPRVIRETFKEKYTRFRIVHYLSSLIESLLLQTKNQNIENSLFVNVRNSVFDLIYLDNSKVKFANTFRYRAAEDFAYFTLYAMEQLKLNPEDTELICMGEFDKNSKLYEIAYKYIRRIKFIDQNDFFKYSYVFNDLPGSYFYNLLNISRCEL